MKANLKKIEEILEEVVDDFGFELYHFELIEGGRKNFLRVYIDSERGITVEDCVKVSRELSVLLDVYDPIPYHYILEVSSPGIERKLYKLEHFKKNVGKEVEVKFKKRNDRIKGKKITGTLKEVGQEYFVVEGKKDVVKVLFCDVDFVKIKYKF